MRPCENTSFKWFWAITGPLYNQFSVASNVFNGIRQLLTNVKPMVSFRFIRYLPHFHFFQNHALLTRSYPFFSRARMTRGLPMGDFRTLIMDQQPMNQPYIIYWKNELLNIREITYKCWNKWMANSCESLLTFSPLHRRHYFGLLVPAKPSRGLKTMIIAYNS